jgi:integrase
MLGTMLDRHNVLREFRKITQAAGLGEAWAPRELRHTLVSIMSDSGIPVEEIARLAGHASTHTTEVVYRRELRPVISTGAEVMDKIFLEPPFGIPASCSSAATQPTRPPASGTSRAAGRRVP